MINEENKNRTLLIHDLDSFSAKGLLSGIDSEIRVICAESAQAGCTACYNCWIKTPGHCVTEDSLADMPEILSRSDRLILISELVYGGYSPDMKMALDRLIPAMLPFFEVFEGRSGHAPRDREKPLLDIINYFYRYENIGGLSIEGKNSSRLKSLAQGYSEAGEGAIPDDEMEIMKRVTEANAANLRALSHKELFIGDKMNLSEVEF